MFYINLYIFFVFYYKNNFVVSLGKICDNQTIFCEDPHAICTKRNVYNNFENNFHNLEMQNFLELNKGICLCPRNTISVYQKYGNFYKCCKFLLSKFFVYYI